MTGISNGRLGTMLLVGTETVLFSSFLGAYIILRSAAAAWPPLGVPPVRLGLSAFNTVLLVISSLVATRFPSPGLSAPSPDGTIGPMRPWTDGPASSESKRCWGGQGAAVREGKGDCGKSVFIVFCLGVLFLGLQGVEFHRLYGRGLTLQTGTYGALFYTLITCHGLHVLGGLLFLAIVLAKARTGAPEPEIQDCTTNAAIYWHFVTGVWLVLFTVLYIS